MGLLAWFILLLVPAAFATGVQYLFFRQDRKTSDYDWMYMACGALVGGFTGHAWYPGTGPALDGLYILPALVGAVLLGTVAELVYRLFLRPRQAH